MDTPENFAKTIIDFATKTGAAEHIPTTDGTVLFSVPSGRNIADLTAQIRAHAEYAKPHRRAGKAQMNDLPSLIEWANRNKGPQSVLFADQSTTMASITAIADYHLPGAPQADGDDTARYGKHRATYNFPLSRKWKKWMELSGKGITGPDMGAFLEDNILDVIDPPLALTLLGQRGAEATAAELTLIDIANRFNTKYGSAAQLFNMAKSFAVYEQADFELVNNSTTGEGRVVLKSEHKDASGAPIDVPKLFLIAIPVFERGAIYRIPVRFQYRKSGGDLKFFLTLHDPERSYDDAFNEGCNLVQTETEMPLFLGKSEMSN